MGGIQGKEATDSLFSKPRDIKPEEPKKEEVKKPVVAPAPAAKASSAPWLDEALRHQGKKEQDSKFSKYLSAFWAKVGLSGYTSIMGSSRAWCGLFIAAMLITVGVGYQKDGAGAKNWDRYGVAVDWKTRGIPRGAIVRINHGAACSSGSGNHVTFAKGDCAAKDLLKKNANFDGYGGNQGNTAKVSTFPVAHICSVRWPKEHALPAAVLVSKSCADGKPLAESTR